MSDSESSTQVNSVPEIEAELNKKSGNSSSSGFAPDKKHSLDSDEEDDNWKERQSAAKRLTADDIEGEEDDTITQEGQIKITPFNLKEEMRSGYFDSGGFFVANGEDEEEIKDSWLDNIDDTKIDEKASEAHRVQMEAMARCNANLGSDSEDSDDDFDLVAFRKIVLSYMEPKESVTRAIKRLSSNVKTAKQSGDTELIEEETVRSNKLMEYVNTFVEHGFYDIYQETHESLTVKINPPLLDAKKIDNPVGRKRGMENDSGSQTSEQATKHVRFEAAPASGATTKMDEFEDMFK